MLHVICATLVLAAALAETTVMRQWTQQYAVTGIQQAAAGAAFEVSYRHRN
jgi:hypothetical protein